MDALPSNVSSIPNLDADEDDDADKQIGANAINQDQEIDVFLNMSSIINLDADKEQIGNQDKEQIRARNEGAKKKKSSVSEEGGNKQGNKSTGEEYKKPLVWIDLEMTGLDIDVDRILEIACIVTGGMLTKSVEGPDLVISQSEESLNNMGEWCRIHHAANGLTERVLKSTVTEQAAEEQVMEFIQKLIGSNRPNLAGNSVHTDRLFLKKYMPKLAEMFPHVLVDVSTIVALSARWFKYGIACYNFFSLHKKASSNLRSVMS